MKAETAHSHQPSYDRVLTPQNSLAELLGEITVTTNLLEMRQLLVQLRLELQKHFEREEALEGFPAVLAKASPEKVSRLNDLFEEHSEFLKSVHRHQDAIAACLSGPNHVIRSIKDLCRQIQKHEAVEDKLLAAVLNEN